MKKLLSNSPLTLFIHIPKCGGSSIINYLSRNIEFNNYTLLSQIPKNLRNKHLSFSHFHLDFIARLIKGFQLNPSTTFTFTLVRNPLSRFISLYNWAKSKNNMSFENIGSFLEYSIQHNSVTIKKLAINSLINQRITVPPFFNRFNVFDLSFSLPMYYYLKSSHLSNLQFVGKLEKIDETINMLNNRYKIETQKIPHDLKEDSLSKLSSFDRDIIKRSSTFKISFLNYYGQDFEIFNYEYKY